MDIVPHRNSLIRSQREDLASKSTPVIRVNEVYLDGSLKEASLIDEDQKSFGIFMHSLILSNYAEVIQVNNQQIDVIGDDYEKAILSYTESKGFDKKLIESIAPKVAGLSFESEDNLKVSAHLINEKVRILSKGTPEKLLERCSYILMDSKFVKVTRKIFREVNGVLGDMLKRCSNVYAIALKDTSKLSGVLSMDTYVKEMTLVALIGMGIM
ncbi:cation transport ATPase-like protein [Anaerobacterium chartisolvens]|uniref:Cation transport ATPase-like protein n=1 Tax=Anaerobacterium chartisolvens TaxID=1297424 RepID=A0A369AVX4_9FIRM|nr:cation-transporting P-type ATPase [Anaerobacterium chartisolvens]RCX13550.1 cation transport ATPase-like protein [Anaerobacterium chartisolvens]